MSFAFDKVARVVGDYGLHMGGAAGYEVDSADAAGTPEYEMEGVSYSTVGDYVRWRRPEIRVEEGRARPRPRLHRHDYAILRPDEGKGDRTKIMNQRHGTTRSGAACRDEANRVSKPGVPSPDHPCHRLGRAFAAANHIRPRRAAHRRTATPTAHGASPSVSAGHRPQRTWTSGRVGIEPTTGEL